MNIKIKAKTKYNPSEQAQRFQVYKNKYKKEVKIWGLVKNNNSTKPQLTTVLIQPNKYKDL